MKVPRGTAICGNTLAGGREPIEGLRPVSGETARQIDSRLAGLAGPEVHQLPDVGPP
jgi:hypothetical protein